MTHESEGGAMRPKGIAARAGRWSSEHRFKAIGLWLAFVAVAVFAGGAVGTETLSDEEYGVGESQQADKALAAGFTDSADETVLIEGDDAESPEFRAAVDQLVTELEDTDNVENVVSPYEERGAISNDGTAALLTYEIPEPPDDADETVEDLVEAPEATIERVAEQNPAVEIGFFGDASAEKALSESFEEDFQQAEFTSLPITLIILVLAFGALMAALVPLLLAATAVAAAIGLLGPLSQIWPIDEAASSVVLLIGLAVGVDYALFYLRREREERARGRGSKAALEAAAATSGRAVLVSGITVATAMAGMYFAGAATFESFATGTILVVAIAVLGSLTVLPAVLSKLGDRVNRGRVPFLTPPEKRAASESRFWGAILDRVLRRPWVAGGIAVVALVVMALPVLNLKMQVPGIDTLPRELEVMQTYDKIQASFPGDQIPATAVIETNGASREEVRAGIEALEGEVAANPELYVGPPTVEVSDDGSVVAVDVPVAGDGANDESYAALADLRENVVPATVGQIAGAEVNVTGITAGSEDFNQIMEERVPIVFAFVLGMAFLLLLGTFRSIVIPIKAILLNLLSVGAAYGLVVWIFQEGNLESLLGFESTGAVTSWLPLFLFVILFGLSMDYHVFILSRVREAYDRGLATGDAVAAGIKSTASVVTAAAVVMIAVFAIFATLSSIEFKQFGVGLAAAILIDATVIRGVLLPATMKLLGDWNWYLPRWLEWLPESRFEGIPEPMPLDPEYDGARSNGSDTDEHDLPRERVRG
jgi:RND superfamily putative drug exporter